MNERTGDDSVNPEINASSSKVRKRKVSSEFTTPCKKPRETLQKTKRDDDQPSTSFTNIDNVLDDMTDEIGDAVENSDNKEQLTSDNVKNILRHVMANEYVLAMVRNTMKTKIGQKEKDLGVDYEPKLTRSKVKELGRNQYTLPLPVLLPSPAKPPECTPKKKLLEIEFPDEDSDEDYKPTEEETHSDDDESPSSPKTTGSPCSATSTPRVAKILEHYAEDEDALIMNIPHNEMTPKSEAEKIALRTRSKLPLNDTPLEAIEDSFVPPDITQDMYDLQTDDEHWAEFLRDLRFFTADESIEELDDINDPEYKAVEEVNDDADAECKAVEDEDFPEELSYDKSKEELRDELNALITETLESSQHALDFIEDLNSEENGESLGNFLEYIPPTQQCETEMNLAEICIENVKFQVMSSEERVQLDEQMRMYVQLITQSYLLSYGNNELNFITVSSKLFLDELKLFSSRVIRSGEKSAFNAINLNGALEIIRQFESRKVPIVSKEFKFKKNNFTIKSSLVRKTLASSKVFIYPEILPTRNLGEATFDSAVAKFLPAEDHLVALGLEQFSQYEKPLTYIKDFLVPNKTEQQIRVRIKNSKVKKTDLNNPLKYYHVFKKVPELQRVVRVIDLNNIDPPEAYPADVLPKWMAPYSKYRVKQIITPGATKVAVVHPFSQGTHTLAKKLNPILPKTVLHSPLKHISPILRKYTQPRKVFTVISGPGKDKPTGYAQAIGNAEVQTHSSVIAEPFSSNQAGVILEQPITQLPVIYEQPATQLPVIYEQPIGQLPVIYEQPIPTSEIKEQTAVQAGIVYEQQAETNSANHIETTVEMQQPPGEPWVGTNQIVNTSVVLDSQQNPTVQTVANTAIQAPIILDLQSQSTVPTTAPFVIQMLNSDGTIQLVNPIQSQYSNCGIMLEGNAQSGQCIIQQPTSAGHQIVAFDNEVVNTVQSQYPGCSIVLGNTTQSDQCIIQQPTNPINQILLSEQTPSSTPQSTAENANTENADNSSNIQASSSNHNVESSPQLQTSLGEDTYQEEALVIEDTKTDDQLPLSPKISSSKKTQLSKKKYKLQKELEASLKLLDPKLIQNDPKREEREVVSANSYLLKVSEIFSDQPEMFESFLKILCKYKHSTCSPSQLFLEIEELLKDYPDLVDEFVGFLSSAQAWEVGRSKVHRTQLKIREFLRKIEIHFCHQPQHISKFIKALSQLKQQKKTANADIRNILQPLLRNQAVLIEDLYQVFPDEQSSVPPHMLTDFEEIRMPDDDSSLSSFETVTLPDEPDPYGGKDCPCTCHTPATKGKHCVKCGIKFIDGRIYIQTGKMLKPAKVIYLCDPPEPQNTDHDNDTNSEGKCRALGKLTKPMNSTKCVQTPENSKCDPISKDKKESNSPVIQKNGTKVPSLRTPNRNKGPVIVQLTKNQTKEPVPCTSKPQTKEPVPCCSKTLAKEPVPCCSKTLTKEPYISKSQIKTNTVSGTNSSSKESQPSTSQTPNKEPVLSNLSLKIEEEIAPSCSGSNNDVIPSSSKLPFDVIEDTVFPGTSQTVSSQSQKSTAPSDFSCLQDKINVNNQHQKNIQEPVQPKSHSRWTRDEDQLIVYNCKRFGITKKSFSASAAILESRTPEEIGERFISLMMSVSKDLKPG